MPAKNVVLPDRQADLAECSASSGRCHNASGTLRESLTRVEDQEAPSKARIQALKDAARVEIAEMERGDLPTELNRRLNTLRDGVHFWRNPRQPWRTSANMLLGEPMIQLPC
jgi:Arc/MetJ-type ribon-helix-helix transcriptional regulator